MNRLTPDDVKDLSRIIGRRRQNWRDQGPVLNALTDLASDGATLADVSKILIAACDPATRTPAGLRYTVTLDGGQAPGGEMPTAIGPRCHACGRSRAQHDAAERLVPLDSRHDFETKDDYDRRIGLIKSRKGTAA